MRLTNRAMAVGTAGFLLAGFLLIAAKAPDNMPGGPGFQGAPIQAAVAISPDKLRPDLVEALADAADGELITVNIIMREQASELDIDAAARIRDKAVRREVVIGLLKGVAERTQGEILGILEAEQAIGNVGAIIRPLWIHNLIGAEAAPDLIRAIAARDDVDYVNLDKRIGEEVFPVQPGELGEEGGVDAAIECGVQLMRAPEVWNQGITGKGVVVGIIDTGCCIDHPDLRNQIWQNPGEIPNNGKDDDNNGFIDDINGWNFRDNTNDLRDTNGHGTHTTGTVAGDGTNGQTTGMAPDVEMMILKFWNNFAGEQVVWNCMEYAVDNDADAITASIGWPHGVNPDRVMWRKVCENAMAAGVVVIYAAGNEGCGRPPDNVRTPGDVPDVLTIGATDCNDNKASFSSCGPITWKNIPPWNDCPHPPGCIKPSVAAPGVNTLSTSNNCSGYSSKSGTSMATPHVAGAVALILEACPDLDHFGVKEILEATARDLGQQGKDNSFGSGRVDAFEAVQAALAKCDRIVPDSFKVTRGVLLGGDVEDLKASDDSYVDVEDRRPTNVADASVEIEVTATGTTDSPSAIEFTVETVTRGFPTRVRIELFNYRTGQWDRVHEEDGPLSEKRISVRVDSNADDYVQAGTKEMKARVGYHDRGVSFVPWGGRYDQTTWSLEE